MTSDHHARECSKAFRNDFGGGGGGGVCVCVGWGAGQLKNVDVKLFEP